MVTQAPFTFPWPWHGHCRFAIANSLAGPLHRKREVRRESEIGQRTQRQRRPRSVLVASPVEQPALNPPTRRDLLPENSDSSLSFGGVPPRVAPVKQRLIGHRLLIDAASNAAVLQAQAHEAVELVVPDPLLQLPQSGLGLCPCVFEDKGVTLADFLLQARKLVGTPPLLAMAHRFIAPQDQAPAVMLDPGEPLIEQPGLQYLALEQAADLRVGQRTDVAM